MKANQQKITDLPDITQDSVASEPGRLNWVGMEHIVLPLKIEDSVLGIQPTTGKINCYVDLQDPKARGIHMSRIYILLTESSEKEILTYPTLQELTERMIRKQDNISSATKIGITFDLFVRKKSLLSDNSGWSCYPIRIWMLNRRGKVSCQLDMQFIYSSTCPCSAALARQLISRKFAERFQETSTLSVEEGQQWLQEAEKEIATPHSQRSIAKISLMIEPCEAFPLWELIRKAEESLKTAVQLVVKREDEQQFARLNGENLMFCEDAARSLRNAFADYTERGFYINVRHLESLHPHDAAAIVRNGHLISHS